MKLPEYLQRKLHWINLPGALLVALLQRTPVIPLAATGERLLISSPVSAILKSTAATLVSLGALHSLAGATTLVTNNHNSPLNAAVGVAIPSVVFGVTGNGSSTPGSWAIQSGSTFPPGLSFSGLTGVGSINVSNPLLTGVPTAPGIFTLKLQSWFGPNQTLDASPVFTYVVVVSGSAVLPPTITNQPLSVTVNGGGTVAFTVKAISSVSPSYQWRKSGVNISNATSDTLILTSVTAADAASYSVVVSNAGGSATSNAAGLAVTSGQISRISNLSVRTNLGTAQTLTVGFVTNGQKNMLVRAVGPSLNQPGLGVTNFYPDPEFILQNQISGVTLAQNDTWSPALSATFASLGAFGFLPGSADAALLLPLSGPVLAQVSGKGSGVLLVEVYDADAASSPFHLTNLSARNQVGTGGDILISGFVVNGSAACTLLFRGIGPALHDVFSEASGYLADPYLEIHETINGVDTTIASNDDWNASLAPIFAQVGAYPFNTSSKDAALLVTLPPGTYTTQVSGVSGGTGDGVVEVYVVP